MDLTVIITSELDGESLRTTVVVTPEELKKFNQILMDNPEIPEIDALKKAKEITR